ncbi:MAG: 30S ribosome-binding factor RbfA [Gemmatimonadota bacterium]|jgi:ribosome-binding factor A
MSHRRIERLNEQLKRELSELIRTQVSDPRVGSVTVTNVRVTSDLSLARVFVRTLTEEEREASIEGLEAAAPYLRRMLGAQLTIRRVPELRFAFDETLDQALRIERLLEEVRPDDGWTDDGDDDGSREGTEGPEGAGPGDA